LKVRRCLWRLLSPTVELSVATVELRCWSVELAEGQVPAGESYLQAREFDRRDAEFDAGTPNTDVTASWTTTGRLVDLAGVSGADGSARGAARLAFTPGGQEVRSKIVSCEARATVTVVPLHQ
jgi:hypothetical protein